MGLLKPWFWAPKLLLFLGLGFPISKMEEWARGREVSLCLQCLVALYCSSSSFVCHALSPAPPCSLLGLTQHFLLPAFPPSLQGFCPRPAPALLACTELTAGGRSRQGASRVSSQPLGKTVVVVVGAAVRGYSSVLARQGPWGLFVSKVTGVQAGC